MSERYSRQKDLVPEEVLANCSITVVGVGAIGRQVALQLAAMGANKLQLIDHDIVEESNIASQGYYEAHLGKAKVNATAETCLQINSNMTIEAIHGRFKRSQEIGDVVFCCVDKIGIRKLIWEAVNENIKFFVDGRMSGEVIRVINARARDEESMVHYPTTLFTAEEAHRGSCTAKSTIYCANIAAGQMVSKFALWMRRVPIENDVIINLISDEIVVSE